MEGKQNNVNTKGIVKFLLGTNVGRVILIAIVVVALMFVVAASVKMNMSMFVRNSSRSINSSINSSAGVSQNASGEYQVGVGDVAVTDENGNVTYVSIYDAIRADLESQGLDPAIYYLDDRYDYLEQIIQAELFAIYPDVNPNNGIREGMVTVKRKSTNSTATEITEVANGLSYMEKTAFETLIANSNTQEDWNNIKKYYTLDGEDIEIAKYEKRTVYNSSTGATTTTYIYSPERVQYRGKVAQYAITHEFLIALMVQTRNPNFVQEVINLANNSEADFVIMDGEESTTAEGGNTVVTNTVQAEITYVNSWAHNGRIEYQAITESVDANTVKGFWQQVLGTAINEVEGAPSL